MPESPDDRLVERTLAGDTAAFAVLVDRYRSRVLNMAYRTLGDRASADDVAQQTFVRAYQALGTYRPGRSFVAWLLAIAANQCRDLLRARRRRPPTTAEIEADRLPAATAPAHDSGDPHASYERAETQARVAGALAQLSDAQRLAVVLVHLQGLSYGEAAEALGRPVGTVKSDVHRALRRLRGLLAPSLAEVSQ